MIVLSADRFSKFWFNLSVKRSRRLAISISVVRFKMFAKGIGQLGHVTSRPPTYIWLWHSELASQLDVNQWPGVDSAKRRDWSIKGHTSQCMFHRPVDAFYTCSMKDHFISVVFCSTTRSFAVR